MFQGHPEVDEDIHENLPADTSLLRRLDLFSLIDAMPQGVLLMDQSLRAIGVNRTLEALYGFERADVVGVLGEYLVRSNILKDSDPFGAVLESGETVTREGDIINKSRKKVPVRFTISPLRLPDGNIIGIMAVLEDISLLKDLDDKVHGYPELKRVIGHSSKMLEIFELLPIIARTDASALITGETGTGKDLVAEAIHKASKRSQRPFIKVNCGALPETLLESELLGHVRGAFTGADRDKPGMFRLAHGGTIFLTEIGDLPLRLQVKLLTVLDDKEFFPVGGTKKVRVDMRIIAATHRDLRELVRKGKFRQDLYFRLNVLRLHLPPLREREDDFRLLLDHFLKQFASVLGKNIKGFSKATLEKLSSYSFPGNVRELRNIVEYAVNICSGEFIEPEHLPTTLFAHFGEDLGPAGGEKQEAAGKEAAGAAEDKSDGATAPSGWKEMEKKMILDALAKTGGKRTRAAELLGWGRSTLWRKIKRYGLG